MSKNQISDAALEIIVNKQEKRKPLTPAEKLALKKNGKMFKASSELRKLRESLGLSERDVAAAVGISHTTVKNYEQGRPMKQLHMARLLRFYGQAFKAEIKSIEQ